MKQASNNDLHWDVLTYLSLSANARLQWRELRDSLHKKYVQYDKESFEVLLSRTLSRIVKSGDLNKDDKRHQEVYYYIPKRRQEKILKEINMRFVNKKMDEYWTSLSLEQKKKTIENIMASQQLFIQGQKNFLVELANSTQLFLSQAEDKLKEKKNDFTTDEKLKLKTTIDWAKEKISRINSSIDAEKNYIQQKWLSHYNLMLEFEDKVVYPYYNGVWLEAIADLIRKTIRDKTSEVKN
jgi:hypothetical protein